MAPVNDPSLADRVVVIIGGTTGLGLSAAQACIRSAGRVVVVGRNAQNVQQAAELLGEAGVAMIGDATEPETAAGAIDRAIEHFGRFDALYHVAGGSGRSAGDGPLHEISDQGWRRTLD